MVKKSTSSKKVSKRIPKSISKKSPKVLSVKKSKVSSPSSKKSPFSFFTSRKFIKIVIITLLILFIFSSLGYVLNIKVKLLFDTETRIVLSPSTLALDIPGGGATNVTFDVNVQKLDFCNVVCKHTLINRATGIIVKNFSKIALEDESFSYVLDIPTSGSGQVIYNYNINCYNEEKSFCPSPNKTYSKSAFLTVDYSLSDENKVLEQSLKVDINSLLSNITYAQELIFNLESKLSSLQYINDTIFSEESSLAANLHDIKSSLIDIQNDIPSLFEYWKFEELSLVAQSFNSIDVEVVSLISDLDSLNLEIDSIYFSLSDVLSSLDSIDSDYYSTIAGFFAVNDLISYNKLLTLNSSFDNLVSQVESKSFSSFSSLFFDVSSFKINLDNLVSNYDSSISSSNSLADSLFDKYNSTYYLLSSKKLNKEATTCSTIASLKTFVLDYNSNVNLSSLNQSQKDFYSSYSKSLLKDNSLNNISLNSYFTFPISSLNNYLSSYCNFSIVTIFDTQFTSPNIDYSFVPLQSTLSLPPVTGKCCLNGECTSCCIEGECEESYPIVLVHGHSFSKATSPELAFTRLSYLQDFLSADGYVHGGTIGLTSDLNNISDGTWGRNPNSLVVGVTYYYLSYHDVVGLNFVTRKTDSIENYAIRLREAINLVLEKTNQDKVIIIAHSMGGLVSREYISLFGEDNVEKLIILGTPNYGVEGDIDKYCTLTGAKAECDDMSAGSVFLTRLNRESKYLTKTKAYTITASGCEMKSNSGKEDGDGVVLARNVPLPYAKNYNISGNCTDLFNTDLHMNFVNPVLYPQTYTYIKEFLAE